MPRTPHPAMLVVLLLSLVFISCSADKQGDLLIHGGTIYTMNPDQPTVEAILVRDGRIVFAGDLKDAAPMRNERTGEIDIKGGIVLPGLVDAHIRLMDLGRAQTELDLVGTASIDQIYTQIMERIMELRQNEEGKDAWVVGNGWDQNDWESTQFPTIADLPPGPNPVCLWRIDGQTVWVNELALRECGIDKNTPDPEGGRILRDGMGNPTGVLLNEAACLVTGHIPQPTRDEYKHWLELGIRACNRVGLTGVGAFAVDSLELALLEELNKEDKLTLRTWAVLQSKDRGWIKNQLQDGPRGETGDMLQVRSMMMFVDGGMGARSAALIEPYADDPGNRGLLATPEENLKKFATDALKAGFQVSAYAVGDRGNYIALNAFDQARHASGQEAPRFRLEHAQLLAPGDFARLTDLDVIPIVMPTHATSDMPWAEKRIGPERIKYAYAWRTLLDNTAHLALGSESPVESPSPLWGIYAAVTRQDHDGNPKSGWYPEHKMTVTEALDGYTREAAYATFAEHDLGTISVGNLADLTILDRDITKAPPREMLETGVLYTIVNGKQVYVSSHKE